MADNLPDLKVCQTFTLQLHPDALATLKAAAKARGVPLRDHCADLLAASVREWGARVPESEEEA